MDLDYSDSAQYKEDKIYFEISEDFKKLEEILEDFEEQVEERRRNLILKQKEILSIQNEIQYFKKLKKRLLKQDLHKIFDKIL